MPKRRPLVGDGVWDATRLDEGKDRRGFLKLVPSGKVIDVSLSGKNITVRFNTHPTSTTGPDIERIETAHFTDYQECFGGTFFLPNYAAFKDHVATLPKITRPIRQRLRRS